MKAYHFATVLMSTYLVTTLGMLAEPDQFTVVSSLLTTCSPADRQTSTERDGRC